MRHLLWMVGFVLGTAQAGELLHAATDHHRGAYSVEVDMRLAAPKAEVWRLLTDYDAMEQLNEAILVSEVLERRSDTDWRVRTVTEACVYFFCRTIEQVQDVVEAGDGYVVATVLPEFSDFRHAVARLYVWSEGDATRVRVMAEVTPDFWVPPLIGPWLITRKLRSEALETLRGVERLSRHEATDK